MTDDGTDALEQALGLKAAPGRLSALRQRPLPGSLLVLLQIAAGHEESIVRSARRTSESTRAVVDAATLYIQQVLFDERADCYRVLGVNPDAGIETIREHYRWMMRWLHPDRHGERWETVYSERVNAAWNTLRQEERRGVYDRQRLASGSVAMVVPATPEPASQRKIALAETVESDQRALLSPWVLRHLPALVLGGMGIAALVVVGLMYGNEPAPLPDAVASMPVEASGADGETVQDAALRKVLADGDPSFESQLPSSPQPEPASPATGTMAGDVHPAVAEATIGSADPGVPVAAALPRTVAVAPPVAGTPAERRGTEATVLPSKAGPRPVTASVNVAVPSRREASSQPAGARGDVTAFSPAEAATSGLTLDVPRRALARPVVQGEAHVLPAAAVATDTPRAGPPAARPETVQRGQDLPVDLQATRILSGAIVAAYSRGDLPEMMRLFAPDAVENRGGIDAIAEDYGTLFRDTSYRELDLDGVRWIAQPTRIVGTGNFQARVWPRNSRSARQVAGWIEIEAVLVGREWKIKSLLHGNRE